MSLPEAVLGVDIGTGGVRATALDIASGSSMGQASAALSTTRSPEGARTQRVEDWTDAVSSVVRDVVEALAGSARVVCVALTSAAHNAVVELGGGVLPPPIVLWQDARPGAALAGLPDDVREAARARARVELDSTWTLVQMRWLANELGGGWKPLKVHLGHGAIVAWLTGEHVTDPSAAAGTGFFDPLTRQWCEDLVAAAGLPLTALPRVTDGRTIAGLVAASAAASTGLERGTPVIVGGTDTACELLAAGMTAPGPVLVKAASSGTAVTVVSAPVENARSIMYPHVAHDNWYLVSPTSSAWSSVSWASAILGGDVVDLACGSIAGAAGLTFLPHLDGERVPIWDRDAVGGYVGLRADHRREDLARATLEGVCFSLADALEYLEQVVGRRLVDVRLSGGGLQREMAASVLASAIRRPARVERAAEPSRGAAVLARMAMGVEVAGVPTDAATVTVEPLDDLRDARESYRSRQRALHHLAGPS